MQSVYISLLWSCGKPTVSFLLLLTCRLYEAFLQEFIIFHFHNADSAPQLHRSDISVALKMYLLFQNPVGVICFSSPSQTVTQYQELLYMLLPTTTALKKLTTNNYHQNQMNLKARVSHQHF